MKYLAFDIEAANGYKPSSICSIGIVIADEQFNIVSRENVWINPKTAYNLNGTRQNVGIDLHLDKKLLDASPDFKRVYPRIKGLLTDKEYVVFGHAVDADVRMLNAACKRYGLPCIDFRFMCSQLLYKMYKGEKEVKALNKIAAELGVEFCQHNSEEDAYATMMTMKYLVTDSGLSVEELSEKYCIRAGVNRNFELTRPVSLDGQVSKKRVTSVAWSKIREYAATVKRTSKEYDGEAFALARSLELSDGETLYAVVKAITEKGGRYVTKLFKCSVYVYGDTANEQDAAREKRVEELKNQGLLKTVKIEDLLEGKI
ncbi:MAG: exonuclease domain-containing protein [Corallococcus sp.]|nr:exonuclease domain-containing protein [Corallococcus sp.]